MRAGLFVCFIAIAGAVGEGCGENEIFKRCGPACQRSCDNPNPTCTDQCVTGCFCSGDRVRDDETQQCIEVSECPAPSLRIKRSKHQDLAIKIPGCGQNEVFKVCGPACQRSCENPNPTCSGQCVTGCFCSGDRVRDDETQQCIEVSKCPNQYRRIKRNIKQDPRIQLQALPTRKRSSLFQDPSCKANEEFKLCETCYRSCDNPTPSCSDHCERGCFCKEGLVRDRDGKCVTLDQCSGGNGTASENKTCGAHKVFENCRLCEKSCNNPNPICIGACRTGCFCEEGYLKHPNGQCVKPQDCPKEVTLIGSQEPSVEDCGSDEEFLSCGWCEPSCSDPSPRCPPGVCTRGCLCRPPLLRHYSGHCVREAECLPQSCPDPSEEYVCRYGCEPRCDDRACGVRFRRCVLGCHCKLGLRRHPDGRCVTPDQCKTKSEALPPKLETNYVKPPK